MSISSHVRTAQGAVFALAALLLCLPAAADPCAPAWKQDFAIPIGPNGVIHDAIVHEDVVTGIPYLYIAGDFTSVGGVPANNIARFNGAEWSPVANGLDGSVRALAVFQGELIAGGFFVSSGATQTRRVARWNGSSWQEAGLGGLNGAVLALEVFAGTGQERLYAGGLFGPQFGFNTDRIASWDGGGALWSALDSGPTSPGASVNALAAHTTPFGERLFVGGTFSQIAGNFADNIASFDGVGWTGYGTNSTVLSLASFETTNGPRLYAGGFFTQVFNGQNAINANFIARWTGSLWTAGGFAFDNPVNALHVHDGDLYAGGSFTRFDNGPGGLASRIARRPANESAWQPVGSGLQGAPNPGSSVVNAITTFDASDLNPPLLYAAGNFDASGNGHPLESIAKWEGDEWRYPVGRGLNGTVRSLLADSNIIYAAGEFTQAGDTPAARIAAWNGNVWSALGAGMSSRNDTVYALAIFNDGRGPALYAAGDFSDAGGVLVNNIARWNGAAWKPLAGPTSTGTNGPVYALAVFDDGTGPALYAGGDFDNAGGINAARIAKWNGQQWSPLDTGVFGGTRPMVHAIEVFDFGNGPSLYVGGSFSNAGAAAGTNNIARWNGTRWSALGTGVGAEVRALRSFNDGSGPALFAGGLFTSASGTPANRVARWNGAQWTALETGTNGPVYALTPFNDGSGPSLIVAGIFGSAGGQPSIRIASWSDSTGWSPFAGPLNLQVYAATVAPRGDAFDLILGGAFTTSPASNEHIARYQGCPVEILPCPVDLAPPFGILDIFDVLAFLNLFEQQDPDADLAPPFGVWDIFDILTFLQIFAEGCE